MILETASAPTSRRTRGVRGAVAVLGASIGLLGFGTASASATSFCYQLVQPHTACGNTSVNARNYKLLADYDGAGASGVKVCVRANYNSGGVLRDCDYDYKYIYPNGTGSTGIVGNDSDYPHTIKGESWYS